MKKLIYLLLIFVLVSFNSCGGDGESSSNNSSNNDTERKELLYNYNSDTTAVRNLNTTAVNDYQYVQEVLDETEEKSDFDRVIDVFVSELLTESQPHDNIPSYAPRGVDKSLEVNVVDGIIDYSSYKLKGDLNNDYVVDYKDLDLLKEALYKKDDSSDLNADGVVDVKDIVYLVARLNTEISYFDFYTLDKKKMNIPSRSVFDSKSFRYETEEKKILVVAKDINFASGFNSGLDDINDVWYKQTGWKEEGVELIDEGVQTRAFSDITNKQIIKKAITLIKSNNEPSPYLIGWSISIRFADVVDFSKVDTSGLLSYANDFKELKKMVEEHFKDTDMNRGTYEYLENNNFYYRIGYMRGQKDKYLNGEILVADHFSYYKVYSKNGKKIKIKKVLHFVSQTDYSELKHNMKIDIESDKKIKGKFYITRVGPDPKDKEYSKDILNNKIEFNDIPLGGYLFKYESSCGCEISLSDKVNVFDKSGKTYKITIPDKKANLGVYIRYQDSNNIEIVGKKVDIISDECMSESVQKSLLTDNEGKVMFHDLPIGKYKIYVDGKYKKTILFCKNKTEIIYIDKRWFVKWSIISSPDSIFNGSVTLSNLKIDCEDDSLKVDPKYGKKCLVDYTDAKVVYSGRFLDSDPSVYDILNIWEGMLALSDVKVDISGGNNFYIDVFAGATESEYVGQCWFEWNSSYIENLNEGKEFDLNSLTSNGYNCNVKFKPCDDKSCQEQ